MRHWWLENVISGLSRGDFAALNHTGSGEGTLVPVLYRITHAKRARQIFVFPAHSFRMHFRSYEFFVWRSSAFSAYRRETKPETSVAHALLTFYIIFVVYASHQEHFFLCLYIHRPRKKIPFGFEGPLEAFSLPAQEQKSFFNGLTFKSNFLRYFTCCFAHCTSRTDINSRELCNSCFTNTKEA